MRPFLFFFFFTAAVLSVLTFYHSFSPMSIAFRISPIIRKNKCFSDIFRQILLSRKNLALILDYIGNMWYNHYIVLPSLHTGIGHKLTAGLFNFKLKD